MSEQATTAPRLMLTPEQAAAELCIGETMLYEQFLSTGRLPSVKIGRARRIKRADLERLVAELEYAEP